MNFVLFLRRWLNVRVRLYCISGFPMCAQPLSTKQKSFCREHRVGHKHSRMIPRTLRENVLMNQTSAPNSNSWLREDKAIAEPFSYIHLLNLVWSQWLLATATRTEPKHSARHIKTVNIKITIPHFLNTYFFHELLVCQLICFLSVFLWLFNSCLF